MTQLLKPLTSISGFPEYTPAQQRGAQAIMDVIRQNYERFGYTPLETAVVERIDTLLAKGISAKEVYGLRRLNAADGDDGSKDVALRFDLTVPMARYVAENYGQLIFPFRRYQMQPVWRGERPQRGRYRQFYQCDIDIIADGALPLTADAEVLACAATTLAALGLQFTLRVNNRKLLQGLTRWAGATTPEQIAQAIKIIDDAEKVGWPTTQKLLSELSPTSASHAPTLVTLLQAGNLSALSTLPLDDQAKEGLHELQQVLTLAQAMVPAELQSSLTADLTIARGLDYYTGTVVETKLLAAPELGSICSGGRYENLTASLGKKQLPGVGLSIGLSRLLSWMLLQPPYATMSATPATVIVTAQDDTLLAYYAQIAQQLRSQGHNVEQHPGGQALGTQLKNAAKRGITWAIIANAEDAKTQALNLKNIQTGDQTTQTFATLQIPTL